MQSGRIRFDRFELDVEDRRLLRDGAPLDLNSRYLDALALLVRENGRLVSKDRFLDDVWRGVPVTDEALTQCIRTLRRHLDDDAANPRFIETVPKHGYRFIAPIDDVAVAADKVDNGFWAEAGALAGAGTVGGGIAGLLGGLIYGFAAASQPIAGTGAISIMLVLLCLCILVALMGGAGVSCGIVVARRYAGPTWYAIVAGGALGGMAIGGLVKLLGVDAFNLLLGQSLGDITGGPEGAILGASVGLGVWLAFRQARPSLRRESILAGILGAVAGVAAIASGGRLMAGSLALLGENFPDSRLQLFSASGFGPIGALLTGALEGGLFAACLVGAMVVARKSIDRRG
ncbi:transcriptional regulator [Sphingomonas lutea]|uniref:Transcriptional regulator n=1 Tax=Sphingomonas lutea TaxID=1045317 RepID=A0A7G9SJC7_9SPHN|nr:transcriptional regulator [Sphingomonas lutea]QNN67952.1 transcriptional regulator [Sphingomonas lutea]